MKISVLGAGAIGCMFGGLIKFHAPELDVLLIVRGEHGRVVCEQGHVRLDGPWGSRNVPVASSFRVEDIAGSDVVLLTVKSQSTDQALRDAAPYLGNAIVLSIQNGINDQVIAGSVPLSKIVMGVTTTNMAVLEPGSVSLQLDGSTVLGPPTGHDNHEVVRRAASVLRRSGLRVIENANALGIRYNKLAINALGYASCLSRSNFITEALCHKQWRQQVGVPIVEECIQTFHCAGIALEKIPGGPDIRRILRATRVLDKPLIGGMVAQGAKWRYNRKPIVFSLGQDLLRGKPTEVDYVNGQVTRLAGNHDLSAPYNQRVLDLVHQIEQRGKAGFFSREEVIAQFQTLGNETPRLSRGSAVKESTVSGS